jgi:hypothetical protein
MGREVVTHTPRSATTVEPKSSHVPMLSRPAAVLDVIRDAASAVATTQAA